MAVQTEPPSDQFPTAHFIAEREARARRGLIGRFLHALNPRRSVRAQIYMGLSISVALVAFASAAAVFLFDQVRDAQDQIREALPNIKDSFQIAQLGSELAAAAPRLVASASRQEHELVRMDIEQVKERFILGLEAMEGMMGSTSLYQEGTMQVRSLGAELIASLNEINNSVVHGFDLAEKLDILDNHLPSTQQEVQSILGPAIDDAIFLLATGFSSLNAPPLYLREIDRQRRLIDYKRLVTLQAQINLGVSILGGIPNLTRKEKILSERVRLDSVAETIARNLENLQEEDLQSTRQGEGGNLRAGLEDEVDFLLHDIGYGEGGMFNVRQQQLDQVDSQGELLVTNRAIAANLVTAVNERLVRRAEQQTDTATEDALIAIDTGRSLLITMSLAIILIAVLIGWLFVERMLLSRITSLSGQMLRMAHGDLEIPIYVKGRDEVAEMAASLQIFRDHAVEIQRLNLVEKLSREVRERNQQLEKTLDRLREAQHQIVTREKLAALGQLSAGIAHELKNPLNFVNNFAELSSELLDEMQEVIENATDTLDEESRADIEEIMGDLGTNLEKIHSHGQRADRIIRSMLTHGRASGEKQATNINNLVSDYADLAYHSNRATNPNFNVTIHKDFDESLAPIEISPQEISRAIVNLVGNACDATDEKRQSAPDDYEPSIWLKTIANNGSVKIHIRDNGTGMPEDVIQQIFNPFFTTKSAGSGTGLGLSMTHDIIAEHGGDVTATSEAGESTEMVITLPYNSDQKPEGSDNPGAAEENQG